MDLRFDSLHEQRCGQCWIGSAAETAQVKVDLVRQNGATGALR